MAWTAVFLTAVLLPLLLFVVDGARLFYLRGRLQTAADAACEDAAWAAGDRLGYTGSGQTALADESYLAAVAQDTFARTLPEAQAMNFTPALAIHLEAANYRVACSATAGVPLLFRVAGIAPTVTIPVSSTAALRFR